MSNKVHIGVDIGKNGCIVIMDGIEEIQVFKMPKIGKEYDLNDLAAIFSAIKGTYENTHTVIEDVHAIFNSSANNTFEFGVGLGIIEMALVANSLPYTKVQPKVWQKLCFQGVPEQRKPASEKQKKINRQGSVDTKAMALIAVKRLYPTQKLTFGDRATKPHDGLVDAILLAHFSKQTYK